MKTKQSRLNGNEVKLKKKIHSIVGEVYNNVPLTLQLFMLRGDAAERRLFDMCRQNPVLEDRILNDKWTFPYLRKES